MLQYEKYPKIQVSFGFLTSSQTHLRFFIKIQVDHRAKRMDISIIIVNYNTFDITCNCLSSVFSSQTQFSFEVILVDNNSKDQDPNLFLQQFPGIILISNKTNVGFGPANNQGIEKAKGKYMLLLNSDTIVNSDTFDKCGLFLESEFALTKNIGLIGCKILNADDSLQPSVFPYLNNNLFVFLITTNPLANLILRFLKLDKHASFNFNKLQQVGDISGAFMFLRAEVISKTGSFDTDFFMYCEDTEWCRERINKFCSIYYYPDTSIIHLGGQSAPRDLMHAQSKLSLSLLWYKKGWLNYIGYVILVYINTLTNLLSFPFIKKATKISVLQSVHTSFKIWPYLFSDVVKYKRATNSRKEKLIYNPASKVMQQ